MDKKVFLKDTGYTQSRELSWLKFNQRVLAEANDKSVPLFERLKFLAIFSGNLDEFYMIRVGSLFDLSLLKEVNIDNKTGDTPEQQLKKVFKACPPLYKTKDKTYAALERMLTRQKISRVGFKDITGDEKKLLDRYFKTQIAPILSPQIIDAHHPFPHLENKTLSIAVMMKSKDKILYGFIPVPRLLPKIFYLSEDPLTYILTEDIIARYAESLFDMYTVVEKAIVCVTRNADISPDDETYEVDNDFRQHIQKILKKRARLSPVRLELSCEISDSFSEFLQGKLNLKSEQVFVTASPLNMSYVYQLEGKLPEAVKAGLLYPPHKPLAPPTVNLSAPIWRQVAKKDLLLSYPYDSMQPLLSFIKQSAFDPAVVSIKITLYRIDNKSRLAEYLIDAAENGKDVTVLMELRARFDEQNNINWAQRLEEAGCRVIYGVEGYKVHAKLCLVTRLSNDRLQYITQVGTGNYNEKTARLYTDYSLMTADEDIADDANLFFKNMLSGNVKGHYERLLVAPSEFKSGIMALIDREIVKAEAGGNGRILMKINSISDRDIIDKLSEASRAGVVVEMIVRGICCIVPGIKGKTENISIISIVGRFLEHARVYCFGEYGVDMTMYIASSDVMTRNTERRVEAACPVLDGEVKKRIYDMLMVQLADNVKARRLKPGKKYAAIPSEPDERLDSQAFFIRQTPEDTLQ